VEINKGMYGLPQAGLLANKWLASRLANYGYFQTKHTPGLWKHSWRPIQFFLVVDNFGVQYENKAHAHHLLDALNNHYEAVSEDWEGALFCGIKLAWNYTKRTVTPLCQATYNRLSTNSITLPCPNSKMLLTNTMRSNLEPKHSSPTQLMSCNHYPKKESNDSSKSLAPFSITHEPLTARC
jgi:hypothetical protein